MTDERIDRRGPGLLPALLVAAALLVSWVDGSVAVARTDHEAESSGADAAPLDVRPGDPPGGKGGDPVATATPAWPIDPATGHRVQPRECPKLERKGVARATIDLALEAPHTVYGWGMLRNPGVPASPTNGYRSLLSISDPGKPYHPVHNGIVYKAGCS